MLILILTIIHLYSLTSTICNVSYKLIIYYMMIWLYTNLIATNIITIYITTDPCYFLHCNKHFQSTC